MHATILTAPEFILAAVFIASAIGKLRRPDDLTGWEALGVPAALRRTWLLRLHPWGELALGVGLITLGGAIGLLASLAAVGLLASYTWVVSKAWARSRQVATKVDCACFGAPSPITWITVTRNVWLLVLALLAASTIWAMPLVGGAMVAIADDREWLFGLAAAALTATLIVWRTPADDASGGNVPAATVDENDELAYIRTRTPAVPVMLANGTVVNLRRLTARRPVLLFAVSATCGGCRPVIDHVPAWRELLPEVELRLLLHQSPEDSPLTSLDAPQTIHDTNGYLRDSINDWPTPTAVLFGADGMLAGGPVSGSNQVAEFIADVYESLHGERPPLNV